MVSAEAWPSPVFEGSEKRLEVDFLPTAGSGLRSLNRNQLDELLQNAGCCIVSDRHNEQFDAYVLSESSLFVFPTKLVLKTCGTTKILHAIPILLELAASTGCSPKRCKYSRASFLFPHHQPEVYQCFDQEVAYLKQHFGNLGHGGDAHILGDASNGLQWHVYVADADHTTPRQSQAGPATYSLEVCMTQLCPQKALQFFRNDTFVSAQHTSTASGIQRLVPNALIDDYVFEPCGYSMNSMEGAGFSTIHITPEEGFSYASFEISNYATASLDINQLVSTVVDIFNPGKMTVALTVDTNLPCCMWGESVQTPAPYTCHASVSQTFSCGGRTAFYSMARDANTHMEADAVSPMTVLESPASLMSFSCVSDSDRFSGLDTASSSAAGDDVIRSSAPKESAPPPPAAEAVDSQMVSVMKVLECYNATMIDVGSDAAYDAFIKKTVQDQAVEDPLYLLDLGAVRRLYQAWVDLMPRVHPFYAVKCNTDPAMVSLLAALGAGFDCASEWEADTVLGLGVPAERIVFANACKRPCDIRFAAAKGLKLTTFDTESELHKLARWHPSTETLLRIRADDTQARCQLGNKYGALMEDCAGLLALAQRLNIQVVGVAFHVGSGATNPQAFADAIAAARLVFDQGCELGFSMRILDIGGGFAGGSFDSTGTVQLGQVPLAVNTALATYFPDPSVKVIAEPGRYFAEASCTFACMVFGIRAQKLLDGEQGYDYWITDGLYGSMNSVMYDHATLSTRALAAAGPAELDELENESAVASEQPSATQQLYKSTVFGPTCDGLDTVLTDYSLPRLRNGDWLVFPNMGAYTLSGASNFNGINSTDVKMFYLWSQRSV
ncbi:Mitochondrial 2-oxoadipate and 2-oxoglutarate transporter [Trebouxia sp. C0009 RCD-2024]